ncbi:leucine--tRNA ligase [Patescibacteria group bacterium]|nr:leucine--tRNA ligase [Patescibacteria group bacterium]
MSYDFEKIDGKWQARWLENKAFAAKNNDPREKYYVLVEFPFPSGAGLHVGHVRSYTALDAVARKKRMDGKNVLFPMGWDAFGLPAENYAIKTGIHPSVITKENTDTFRRQLQSMGFSFDWDREIDTTDPKYYRWTQWMFLEFFKAGLAYKATTTINWCPKDKTGLANEEVVAGACERCGTPVEKREKEQWMLAITKYADRLIDDLKTVDYLPKIKKQQEDWIGRSEGAEISFALKFIFNKEANNNRGPNGEVAQLPVFTTRPDTIFGVTYIVIAPEHPWVTLALDSNHEVLENKAEVTAYVEDVKKRTDIDRTNDDKEKTGVELKGIKAINPATGEEVPVWVGDYVLPHYGTGVVMAVPQHDERDAAFAKKYNLPVLDKPLVSFAEALKATGGKKQVKYKLRDWVFSRQRYWGEPIPLIHCEKDGWVAVPEDQLPVTLPQVEKYEPTDNGESPLSAIDSFVNTTCPTCNGPAKRETDTMPNWAGSSWYFLRYIDPNNDQAFASKENLKYWMPVDLYNGGMEHTTLHLLYSRFWNKVLFDRGHVPVSEPYHRRHSHGLILAEDGSKMSKSKGNVVNPDEIVYKHGADTLRVYELFIGPFEEPAPWSMNGVAGVKRFLDRSLRLIEKVASAEPIEVTKALHKTIKKVGSDLDGLHFNTAVSQLMMFVNAATDAGAITKESLVKFAQILCPLAPHVANEIAERLGESQIAQGQQWPIVDESLLIEDVITISIQVNGKLRGTVSVAPAIEKEALIALAQAEEGVAKFITGEPKKVIVVPGKIVNFVV